jgi:membrane-bound serine protease (ClpP class)
MMLSLAQAAPNDDWFLILGFILLGVSIGLLLLELIVPSGGMIGLLCGVAVVGSVVCFFRYDTLVGVIALLGYLTLGPMALVFGFKVWVNSPLAARMILGARHEPPSVGDEEAHEASERARRERIDRLRPLIGARGRAVTALRPVGVVKIDGRRIDAMAEMGVIEPGTEIVVIEIYDNQVKVRPA